MSDFEQITWSAADFITVMVMKQHPSIRQLHSHDMERIAVRPIHKPTDRILHELLRTDTTRI